MAKTTKPKTTKKTTRAMTKRRKVQTIEWRHLANMAAIVDGRSRSLSVNVVWTDGRYLAAAISVPHEAANGGVQTMLDDHAHEVIGEFDNVADARAVCEAYARRWLKSQKAGDRCKCGPISKELHR